MTLRRVSPVRQLLEGIGWSSHSSESQQEPSAISEIAVALVARPVGFRVEGRPLIASVTLVDLDRDSLMDVLVCDILADRIGWIRQDSKRTYAEHWIGPKLKAPARVQAFDIDGDGDLDLLVAVMGQLQPTNDKIGSIVILENTGKEQFVSHVIAERIARVTDVRGGDLDGDGDMDLAVGQFGYHEGETRWMENLGGWKFKAHILQNLAGPIHTIPADIDKDGDIDIMNLVSQEWEEIYLFENQGAGRFNTRLIWGSTNDDFGCSGMRLVDLDQDGDLDVLFSNGDCFDYLPPRPRPWHGVQWLENKGGFEFAFHRIGDLNGASAACAADMDNDGDLDVVAASACNLWENSHSQSIVWFENRGKISFTRHDLAYTPTHLMTLEAADLNGDGTAELVSGGMHFYPPYAHLSRITLWSNQRRGFQNSPPNAVK
ncbi:MAG: VCBS repeat-containing protein [Acidobacteria bacterium]|nr:VCBS repeat-containing protein [Acidobacteriota bacterium]